MDSIPEDTLTRRFGSFWIALGLFLSFALVLAILYRISLAPAEGDPGLDGGDVGARRVATLSEVRQAQADAAGSYAWTDREAGTVRVPLARAVELAAPMLAGRQAVKTDKVIPGTATAQEIFERQQAAKAAAGGGADIPSDAQKILIKAVPNQIKYDTVEFEVVAGKPVVITFQNPDVLQHNLLILAPGSKDKVGNAANLMAADPAAFEKGYIPDMPEVLHATQLVNPNEATDLVFTAPEQPGDYPYLCTFPGHWMLMNGVMKVVPAN